MRIDLLIRGANIRTMDPARPFARAMGVLNGRVLGFDEDLDGVSSRREIDLGGLSLVPGFIDAHCHTTWFGLGLVEPSVEECVDLGQVLAKLREAAKNIARDGWLVASGYHPNRYREQLSIAHLDAAAGDVPVFVRHNSGHAASVNSAALRRVGLLQPGSPNPVGGSIVRDASGRATGIVEETAQSIFQAHFLPRPLATLQKSIEYATAEYARQGITSFTDAGIGGGWIGQSPIELEAYQRVADAGRLAARAQLMPVLESLVPLASHRSEGERLGMTLGARSGLGSDLLSLGPVKVFLDGSLLAETAAMTEPYCTHKARSGYFQMDLDELRRALSAVYRSGWSVAMHAIGDRAMDEAIDIIEQLQNDFGTNVLPNRIEHASITRPEHLPRLASAGIAVTPQAAFLRELGDPMTESLGEERARWAYRAASFLAAGVVVAGSSDRPVVDGDALRGMQAFVDRTTRSGRVFGDPAERLTKEQALAVYTTGAAAATGTSQRVGSLTPGKLADAVVLSGDPLAADSFTDVSVRATMLAGELRERPAIPAQ